MAYVPYVHVISLPVFMTQMIYNHPLWSVPLASSITLYIQGPLSSHCTATVDPAEETKGSFDLTFLNNFFSDGSPWPCNEDHHY